MTAFSTGQKRVVVASALGLAFGYSSIGVASFGAFVVPLEAHFGWGRGDMSLALTFMSVAIILLSPASGALLDHYGVRRVLLPATLAFGLTTAAMAAMRGSLAQFYAMYLLMAVAGVCTTPASYSRVIVAWFDEHRGMALGMALAGIGGGSAIIPPLVQQVTAALGWRAAYIVLALLVLLVSLLAIAAWVREPAAQHVGRAEPVREDGFAFAEAIRRRAFVLLVTSFALLGVFNGGILAHLMPLLIDRGVRPDIAAGVTSLLGVALIAGRLITGLLLDRLPARLVVAVSLLGPAIGLALLLLGATGMKAVAAVILMGLGLGAEMDFMSFLVSRYFGLRAFGMIYGFIYAALTIGISIGPIVMGYSQQLAGNYDWGLKMLLGSVTAAVLPLLVLGPYPELPRRSEAER